jgi:hypothetical protein
MDYDNYKQLTKVKCEFRQQENNIFLHYIQNNLSINYRISGFENQNVFNKENIIF